MIQPTATDGPDAAPASTNAAFSTYACALVHRDSSPAMPSPKPSHHHVYPHNFRRNAVAAASRVSPIRHARASFGNSRALTTWMVLSTTTDSETAVAVEDIPASDEPAAEPATEATAEAAEPAAEQRETRRRTTGANTRRKRVTVTADQLVPGAQFTGKVVSRSDARS